MSLATPAADEGWERPAHVPPDLARNVDIFGADRPGADPFETLAGLQRGPRVFFNLNKSPVMAYMGGYWMLTRAEDMRAALQQPGMFSSADTGGFSRLIGEAWKLIPLELDPPEHTKWRTVMNGIFAPRKIADLEAGVRARAIGLVDAIAGKGGCEFMEAFGRPFPVGVFMQLMGLPEEDTDKFMAWEYGLLHSHDMPQILTAAQATVVYLRELIARRKREPADDLTTFCINAQIDGRPVADDEIVGMCFLLFLAGLDTVAAALGLSFRHLALHPEHQAQLRARPELIPDAVEELLRRYSMITSSRLVTEDMEFAGAPMRQGDRVIFSTPLANLDAGEFDQPLAVDFERTPNRHVAFLYGPHRCLGSHLARRELIIAMQEFLQRTPPFRLAPGETAAIAPGGVVNVPKLQLTWT